MNLLIALMGSTYEETVSNSTLEYRVNFARLVLKTELEWGSVAGLLGFTLQVGKKEVTREGKEKFCFPFKNVISNSEGYGNAGNNPLFDASVEQLFHDAPAFKVTEPDSTDFMNQLDVQGVGYYGGVRRGSGEPTVASANMAAKHLRL